MIVKTLRIINLVKFRLTLVVPLIFSYLQVEWEVRRGTPRLFTSDSMRSSNCRVPLQDNSSDCGLYLLQYAESFLQVRKRLICSIWTKAFDIKQHCGNVKRNSFNHRIFPKILKLNVEKNLKLRNLRNSFWFLLGTTGRMEVVAIVHFNILKAYATLRIIKWSSLIGSPEPRGALRPPSTFGQLVSAATSATEARGDPQSDNEDASESEWKTVKPPGPKQTLTEPLIHLCNKLFIFLLRC